MMFVVVVVVFSVVVSVWAVMLVLKSSVVVFELVEMLVFFMVMVGVVVLRMYDVFEVVLELFALFVILMWNLLVLESVMEVFREVLVVVLWLSLVNAMLLLTDICRMLFEAMVLLRVAVRVWVAVLVRKLVVLVFVSSEMSMLLKLIVGAVVFRV